MLMRRAVSLRHVVAPPRRAYAAGISPPAKRQKVPSLPKHDTTPPKDDAKPSAPRLAYLITGTFGVGLGFYTLQLYLSATKPCHNPQIAELSQQKDVAARYDNTASSFDSDVGLSELLMGINGIRKKLAQQCHGDVLEVSCGTGRNLGYYNLDRKDGALKTLSLNDLSPQMVEVCRQKWETLYGNGIKSGKLRPDLKVRFMTGSALGPMPLAPSGKKYDTIFQTMGICSTAEPLELLGNMVKHLDTSKAESRILLLEHGRSYLPWMNRVLDNAAEKHAEQHGCWFNRDIGQLVQDAAEKTGMEVVRERRHHLGTTWVFELKPLEETVRRVNGGSILANDEVDKAAHDGGWLSRLGWK
ncbi:hypothetical protein LTR62_007665 [Meristemomyces frigidus]|uniref:S-adenosyl-L-methionine-dependent methyltransferase n=1 Tax=Meristemomyces frigidus TaxID=1508187 RepID=A0AAN7YDE2_9PEZI|nr:hypothetical protein LTR62_007665 [Meristemomyces frigidus]